MKSISSETLNFIIAVSAIAISAASFYATYLQARAADQQVKAMTYPLLQLDHGNFDLETQEERLHFTLVNSGVGPARVKQLNYSHEGKIYDGLYAFLEACCSPEYIDHKTRVKAEEIGLDSIMVTSIAENQILSAGDQLNLLTMMKTDDNAEYWTRLNDARFENFSIELCYCSLLDQCYELSANQQVTEVAQCGAD